jgi:hypothetical protein
MENSGKHLVIECHGYSIVMDSLKFHLSVQDLLRKQTDELLILSKNMLEIKEETDFVVKHPEITGQFENSSFLAAQVSEQLHAVDNFQSYFSNIQLKDQRLIFAIHEQNFLPKLVISILLLKKYEVNVFHIHKFFSLIHIREKPDIDNSKIINMFTCKAVVKMTYVQFTEYLKLGSFKTENFISTFFENVSMEFKCWLKNDLKFIVNVLDFNESTRSNAMGVYMLPIFTSSSKREKIINLVVEQLPEKRIATVQAFYEKNFNFDKAKENIEPILVNINPKDFLSNFKVYAGASDLGHSNILLEDESMIIEELTVDETLRKRRLYFRENIHLIQSELKISDGKPDFSKLGLKVYKDMAQRICEYSQKVGADHQVKVCMLGGGAACFASYLSTVTGENSLDITVIDNNPKLKRVAEDFFYFKETEKLRYIVADAISFINESAIGSFDVIIVDIDSKTDNSPPQEFLSEQFVNKMMQVVKGRHAESFVTVNCVYENFDLLDQHVSPFKANRSVELVKHEAKKQATLIIK